MTISTPIRRAAPPPREGGLPITWLLSLTLIGLVLTAVLPVVALGYYAARESTGRLLRDRSELVLDLVVERLSAHLDPVRAQMTYLAAAIREGRLDPNDDAGMAHFVLGALAATPQVVGISVTRSNLSVRRYDRADGRSYDTLDASIFPAVVRSVEDARVDPEPRWFGPLVSPLLAQGQVILALRMPLRGPAENTAGATEDGAGPFLGVLVAAISVAELSRYVGEIGGAIGQTAFILSGRDRVLAHPALSMPKTPASVRVEDPLPRVDGFYKDTALANIWAQAPNPLTALAPFRRSSGHFSWVGDGGFDSRVYVYREIMGYGDTGWIVGVHYRGSDSRYERWLVLGAGLGSLLLLALSVGAAIILARRLGRPVLGLAEAAARIESLEFDGVRRLPRGRVRELNRAAGAFERMAAGLVWFETYLPKTLVRRLVAHGMAGAPEAETREVTVLFTDLENYTAYSADRPASEVVSYLNQLLSRVGPLIEESGGTIDKYIGDSIMAFWGAPELRTDHAADACGAALAIAAEVSAFNAERRANGLHACRMRLGLHSGTVAVGNVGFSGRVDYTIIGRTVNTAQRLEQSGKEAVAEDEVVVLVSETTQAQAGPHFVFVPCPSVRLDGAGLIARLIRRIPRDEALPGS